jgi:hypothetical protein
MALLILALSAAPDHPISPYCIPLAGSSGFISPSSILVKIMLANLVKISSIFSPDKAETSIASGMSWDEAHLEASELKTSLPSATVTVFLDPTFKVDDSEL